MFFKSVSSGKTPNFDIVTIGKRKEVQKFAAHLENWGFREIKMVLGCISARRNARLLISRKASQGWSTSGVDFGVIPVGKLSREAAVMRRCSSPCRQGGFVKGALVSEGFGP